jgi:hypothetical protein
VQFNSEDAEQISVEDYTLYRQNGRNRFRFGGGTMRYCSKLFWFTAIVGSLSSVLSFLAALRFFNARSDAMDALCRQGKAGCSWESLQHLYHAACTAHVMGTLLSFGLAYIIGRGFIKPAPADAAA